MRILAADTFPDAQLDELTAQGHDCTCSPGLDAGSLPARAGRGTES